MRLELRSDTFTRPTEGMRRAMAAAEVGDDVWGEDPTVRALEERAAALVGKEAALLVPSGTMGNAIGLRLHAAQGDEAYAHEDAHVSRHEAGGPAALWGVTLRPLRTPSGRYGPDDLAAALPPDADDPHVCRPALAWVEDTQMAAGGTTWPLDDLAAVAAAARAHGLALHMDGARLLNAAVAQGVPAAAIAAHVDTVQYCLSKGLGAPVGSILAGPAPAIARARRLRKLLGGGMRQAGVIAAAGLYALDHHVDRLAEDHAAARALAEGLAASGRLACDPAAVETNIVIARVARAGDDPAAVCADLAAVGVLAAPLDARSVRFVTSYEVDASGIAAGLSSARTVLR